MAVWEDGHHCRKGQHPNLQSHSETISPATQSREKYPQDLPRGRENDRSNQLDPKVTEAEQVRCTCGKVCKNRRGLNIHLAKGKCQNNQQKITDMIERPTNMREGESQVEQRTDDSGETEGNLSQEANHSAQDTHASQGQEDEQSEDRQPNSRPRHQEAQRKERVKWPKASQEPEWRKFEEDLENILEAMNTGPAERRLRAMTNLIHTTGMDRFGAEPKGGKIQTRGGPSRRQREIKEIRKQIRGLKKQWRRAEEQEKQGLAELRDQLRDRLKSLRSAEAQKRKRKKKEKARNRFLKNPYSFTRTALGQPRSGELDCPKEELELHLKSTYSDPDRDEELPNTEELEVPAEPVTPFDEGDIKWAEVQGIIKKARAKSAPGANGIPYAVYKQCPRLLRRLWKLLRIIWKNDIFPREWTL